MIYCLLEKNIFHISNPFVKTRRVFAIDYQWDLPNLKYNLFIYYNINLQTSDSSVLLIFQLKVALYCNMWNLEFKIHIKFHKNTKIYQFKFQSH